MISMLEERTKDDCEKQVSTLNSYTWSRVLTELERWHSTLQDEVQQHNPDDYAGLYVKDQQGMADRMTELKKILESDFVATMAFVDAKPPPPKKRSLPLLKRPAPAEEEIAEANESRKRFVTDVKDLPDHAAWKAIAGLWEAMKHEIFQRRSSYLLDVRVNETEKDDLEAWDVYAKKHWEETYGSSLK